ncbi:hypothetical protein [Allocoleopsis sp.]|uniref:hypothetical protein n=1 Tax=Allocoleopsis sp. TaxID=3088169 RepID=UPI002FD47EA6
MAIAKVLALFSKGLLKFGWVGCGIDGGLRSRWDGNVVELFSKPSANPPCNLVG